ncbi:MAG: DNA-3-methyladenine glycosylase I [Ignavibacteria bacterium]|nr:DNA-3-methyladenine glycosylase I [Ignavibacteria bacterium]
MKIEIKKRCQWADDDEMLQLYHDNYWGVPPRNDNELFERMTQQIFQAGLSWKIIWSKHKNFHKAFSKFSVQKVANYDKKELKRLLNDATIVRNRTKINATLENAKRIIKLKKEFGSFRKFLNTIPNELLACQKAMKEHFVFMGPEITRMFVFNIGKIPFPHEKQCWKNTNTRFAK